MGSFINLLTLKPAEKAALIIPERAFSSKYAGTVRTQSSIFCFKKFSERFFTENPDQIIFEQGLEKKTAVDISKEIFSYIKNLSQNCLKQKIDDCVLTVPAYFDEKARSGIMRAAFLAGFNVRRLINEPTAAAFAYGLEKKKKRTFFSL